MSLVKFESMLKTNAVYFFDLVEFEEIIIHYLDAGKHALAKKAVTLGLQQHPASVDLKLLQVEIYIFEDALEKASLLLKRIERLEPNNDEVFIQKATISSKKGNHKEAISFLKKALSYTNDKVDVWSLMGMEYLYLDEFENARLNFIKCIDVDYEDYSALYNVVYCFDMEKEHESAIKYLNSYININPYCEVAWHQLGRQYFILDMFKEALTSFDYAVLIDESFIGGYLEKAKTLEQLERYQEAIDNKEKPPNSLIILDDIAFSGGLKGKQSGQITRLACNGRHINLSFIATSQKYSMVSTTLRENATGLIIWESSNKQLELISDDHNNYENKKDWLKMVRKRTAEPHSFFVINYSNPPNQRFLTMGFEPIGPCGRTKAEGCPCFD